MPPDHAPSVPFPPSLPFPPTLPFPSVEAAWFATAASLQAPPPGPSWASDVLKCVDRLYRNRRLDLLHARILRFWGVRGVAPLASRPRERSDWQVWHEAMGRLDGALRARGLVAPCAADDADPSAFPDRADATAQD